MDITQENESNQIIIDFDTFEVILEPQVIVPEIIIDKPKFIMGCIDNISEMLPKLYYHQHYNVALAERRFMQGKGVMFTDGTGTGKTFSGLGIAYRFYHQDKKDILIVVPTDQKCLDWIEEALALDLVIEQIGTTKDSGHEITVTTYANFYQNQSLLNRDFDLIMYDESHYLGQNAGGVETSYYEQHKKIAKLPSYSRRLSTEIFESLLPERDGTNDYYKLKEHYYKIVQLSTELIVSKTKVAFFSATPFAYHKSIKYADGTLFDIEERVKIEPAIFKSYNEGGHWADFLIENFGYQMRYNKITIPESGVDLNLMERMFFEKMKDRGVMSTKVLQLETDYSRDFVTVDSDLGSFINSGMELFYELSFQKTFPVLYSKFKTKYNYMYVNQLLECIKAREIIKRIQQHIDLGRKVVIFHSYNHAAVAHPFKFDSYQLLTEKERGNTARLEREIRLYAKLYPKYDQLDLSHLKNTRDTLLEAFPRMKQFNGTINKTKRREFLKDFNDDNGTTNVFLVQQKAGKEGISLHDVTGVYQRVLIQLGLPTEPTGCIQIEGRTYRQGVHTNAPYEYITLQTTFERIAFGEKIALRSRTAENLAMGNLARNLENSFKEGYLNSSYSEPSLYQGTGGKEIDKFDNTLTDFDKALTYYYTRQKRNSSNKAKEGGDYFATPEPLGYKMLEWLKPQPSESGLEPSSGHGAIARFFPSFTDNHFIEQNINLTGELCINSDGVVKVEQFELHSPINKYEFIAMNPPFGTGGKLAMEHVVKALIKHSSRYDFRLMAIVPAGPSMGKRVKEFFDNPINSQNFYLKTMIKLPSCVFARTGTTVMTNIIHIVKQPYLPHRTLKKNIDLSHIETITEFFEEIRDLEL